MWWQETPDKKTKKFTEAYSNYSGYRCNEGVWSISVLFSTNQLLKRIVVFDHSDDTFLIHVCLIFKGLKMALSFLLVLAATVILIRPETPVTKVQDGCYSAKVSALFRLLVLFICERRFVYRPYSRTHSSAALRNREWTIHVQTTLTVNQVMSVYRSTIKKILVHHHNTIYCVNLNPLSPSVCRLTTSRCFWHQFHPFVFKKERYYLSMPVLFSKVFISNFTRFYRLPFI